jgi:recombination protein RecA
MALEISKKDDSNNTPKAKALELAIQSIEKQFGKGSIMRLGTGQSLHEGIQAIPTGSLSLDIALGIGGIPKGRVVEIYGPESSGKTTLALTAIAECQKQGGTAAFVDAEHALDVEYARKLGVDTENMLISQPDTGEQALEIVDMLIKSSAVDILVVDSVAALVPRAELEGEMGDATMGAQARLMSQALRKLTGSINRSKSTVIFINQIRMKIGVMFGNPETTTGGNALKFYASVRMDVRRIAAIKNGDDVIGNRTRVKVVKNKVSPPFKEVEFDILYGKGICKEGDLLDLATTLNLIEKSGTWYSYNGERLGQGRESAREWLKTNPKVLNEIRDRVLKAKGIENKGSGSPDFVAAPVDKGINGHAKPEVKVATLMPPPKAAEAAKEKAPANKAKH